MQLTEFTNEQRRQLIDVRQAFAGLRNALRKIKPGSMHWASRVIKRRHMLSALLPLTISI